MKKIILLVLVLNYSWGQNSKNVLFLGNSYTATNNLPELVKQIALSTGNNITYSSNTPGGYTFQGHSSNATSTNLIQQGNWDFVVLQEQSQIPSFPDDFVNTSCYPYAQELNTKISQYNPCAETIFYMTWGRENGDSQNCATNPPVCTYEGMDNLLQSRYMQMGTSNQAVVSPVGAVWRYIRTNHPTLQLYSGDGSHPSLLGSYLAACTFYTVIFRNNPELITYHSSLNSTDTSLIKEAVKTIVYDQLSHWYIGNYDTTASFTASLITGTQFQFTNNSTFADSYLWDFGDGTTSTEVNPIHTYSTISPYTVTLTATRCHVSKQTNQSLNLLSTINFEKNKNIELFPNPVENVIHIKSNSEIKKVELYNSFGQKIKSTEGNHKFYQLDVSEIKSDVYLIKIYTTEKVYWNKILKQ